jgi:hypothetical protein
LKLKDYTLCKADHGYSILDRISIANQAAKAELKNQERDMAGYAGLIKMRSIGSNIQGPSSNENP